jgi:hypothetical protein
MEGIMLKFLFILVLSFNVFAQKNSPTLKCKRLTTKIAGFKVNDFESFGSYGMDLLAGVPQLIDIEKKDGDYQVQISKDDFYFKQSDVYKLSVTDFKNDVVLVKISKDTSIGDFESNYKYVCHSKTNSAAVNNSEINERSECLNDSCQDSSKEASSLEANANKN